MKRLPKATSPSMREQELTGMALDLVEEKIRDGTASSQLLLHFVKLASAREEREARLQEEQIKLAQAKTKAYDSSANDNELYLKAINAMRVYSNDHDHEHIDEEPNENI